MDEKICKLFLPLIDKLYNQEPYGEPFRQPVDVVKYGCYNYYTYIKNPIDLSTIRDKLTNLEYQSDAWSLVADIQLMFDNAYLYNKRGTVVYDYTNKLNKIWLADLTPIMQRLNYCCGTLHKFGPQLLYCHGTTPDKYCQIPIGAKYKCFDDQYSFCLTCFNKIGTDSVTIPERCVSKSNFIDCTNDHWQYESFVECIQCKRKVHKVCELYPDTSDYIQMCNHCYRKKRIGCLDLRHRKYSARRLPHTRMSRYIETKVNEHIRENSPSAGEVTIRVLTAYRDTILVKKEMREYVRMCREKEGPQHPNSKSYPDEFGYTNRAIFAWQEIDGVDVCVFGMHVQEYGEDCPEPNRQVVYLSYLDSVHFFRPKQVRTAVYHEILLSYFKYVKKLGFRRVFIWVCPSRKGDDYIFYRHPTEQKMPTLKRLLDWYLKLLDKGIIAGIVENHQNIHQYASTENWTSIMSVPYLSGDYWPGEFERLLTKMTESQQDHEMKLDLDAGESPDSYASGIYEKNKTGGSHQKYSPGQQNISSSTDPSPMDLSIKNSLPSRSFSSQMSEHSFKSDVPMSVEEELTKNFQRSLKRQKEGFIIARLSDYSCSPHFESQCRKAEEPNFSCELMKGREPFLQLARLENYEFSTLRRAKFSSLAMVKHLAEKSLKLEPICSECYSFDSNKRHYSCSNCDENGISVHAYAPLVKKPSPPPSQTLAINASKQNNLEIELDQILVENFIRQAEISYGVDFDQMKNESRKVLAHYWTCSSKETCHRCKFVVLSCSFMSVLMRSTRMQPLVDCEQSENMPKNTSSTNHGLGQI